MGLTVGADVKGVVETDFDEALDMYVSEVFGEGSDKESLQDKIAMAAYAVSVTSPLSYGYALKSMYVISGLDISDIRGIKEVYKGLGLEFCTLYSIANLSKIVNESRNGMVRYFADKIIRWNMMTIKV